jgi:hypothetical protein
MMRLAWCLVMVMAWACEPISERKQPPPSLYQLSQSDLNLSGEQLAKGYCAACHLMPDPSILDKKTWTTLLPDMRKRMGLYLEEDFGTALPEDEGVPQGIYSKIPYITRENWEKLEAYYLENAPESPLPQDPKQAPKVGIPGFRLEIPEFPTIRSNLTTLLSIHPQTGDLLLGHRFKSLYRLESKKGFSLRDSIPTAVAPVDLQWNSDQSFDLLAMGLMDPANDSLGVLSHFSSEKRQWKEVPRLNRLMRPVDMEISDWNQDGNRDYLVSQFGNHLGKLSLFLSKGKEWNEVILKSEPGARRTLAVDFDQDGDLDILALMTQAKEGIFLFENDGKSKFKEKQLLAFHPAFGSSDFRWEDLDGDGKKEIILVNGDNADQSQILKKYHGVHVFAYNLEGTFEEAWFYPMHGASGIELGDFDLDGKKDLFVISFFPDKKQNPKQNLLFFKQIKDLMFTPFALDKQLDDHWLTLTKGDLDLDGDEDLVIGTFAFDQLYQVPNRPWRPFVVLRNTLR